MKVDEGQHRARKTDAYIGEKIRPLHRHQPVRPVGAAIMRMQLLDLAKIVVLDEPRSLQQFGTTDRLDQILEKQFRFHTMPVAISELYCQIDLVLLDWASAPKVASKGCRSFRQ
jgi:hypothetical protein